MKLKYEYCGGGRDIYADKVECSCPNPLFKGTNVEYLMKTNIRLSGYADDYFFDTVNKEPREAACDCGRKFKYQWLRSHVEFEWVF